MSRGLGDVYKRQVGERARKTEEFKDMLEKRTGFPVILWDERLTTVEANGILRESGVPASERKKVIDQVAAGIILQSYLDTMERMRFGSDERNDESSE